MNDGLAETQKTLNKGVPKGIIYLFLGMVVFLLTYFNYSLYTPKHTPLQTCSEDKVYSNTKQRLSNTQRERQLQIKKACEKIDAKQNPKFSDLKLLYNDNKSLIYCSVAKAACTNWKRMLLYFEGKVQDPMEIEHKQDIHHKYSYKFVKTLSIDERSKRMKTHYKFLFVRHPFERLLSAFRNKFLDPYNLVYRRIYGPSILKLSGKNFTSDNVKNITFKEFVISVIHNHEKSRRLDSHWRVMNKLCTPCTIKYDFIGKMKTLMEDAKQVLQHLGVDDTLFPFSKDKYEKDAKDMMQEYYKTITSEQVLKLYGIYKDDFDLFGYTIPEYLLK